MRWKLFAAAGWACVGLAMLAGAQKDDEVRTRRLVIEDDSGRPTIVLGPSMLGGYPQIRLQSPTGRMSATVEVSRYPEWALVSLRDTETGSSTVMTVGVKGPIISAYNGTTKKAKSLSLMEGPPPGSPAP